MNHKRKKCKRSIRCAMCTPVRWRGNSKARRKDRENAARKRLNEEAKSA